MYSHLYFLLIFCHTPSHWKWTVQYLAYGMFKCLDKNPSEKRQVRCLLYFDPVSLGTKRRELLTSKRLSVDAFKQFPEPCTSGNYVSRHLHVRGCFDLLLEEINLCSSLWNVQVLSSRQALASSFAFHLQCEGLHPSPPPSLPTRKTSSDRRSRGS